MYMRRSRFGYNRILSTATTEDDNGTTSNYSKRYYYEGNGNMTARQTTRIKSTEATVGSDMKLSGRSTDTGIEMEVYRYDSFNRLSSCNGAAVEATYTYNADNLRSSKTVNGNITDFVWNGQNLAAEYTDDSTNVYTYDMTGIHTASIAGTVVSYLKDYHGNIVGRANKSETALADTTDYDAFGNKIITAAAIDNFGYCGEYCDGESGLVYLRNRYYDTATGRFITEDLAMDGVNWYIYCNGNPILLIDPMGLYDREAAVAYALKYSVFTWDEAIEFDSDAPLFRFEQDCTNFVSFCLYLGGGMKQSDDWYFGWAAGTKKNAVGSWSKTWTNSEEQFKAFTNCTGEFPNTRYNNDIAICIHESRWIAASIEKYNIQKGDILYFQNPETLQMGHTAIIVSTENGRIRYAQHDSDKDDGDLGVYLDTHNALEDFQYVYVVRIRDDA